MGGHGWCPHRGQCRGSGRGLALLAETVTIVASTYGEPAVSLVPKATLNANYSIARSHWGGGEKATQLTVVAGGRPGTHAWTCLHLLAKICKKLPSCQFVSLAKGFQVQVHKLSRTE